jgi:hypothetical protein
LHRYDAEQAEEDLQKLLLNSKEIESLEVIGKGSFGEVHKANYRGTTVAVKTLKEVRSTPLMTRNTTNSSPAPSYVLASLARRSPRRTSSDSRRRSC